ncbi:tyrosine-type recombinase/integrase [Microbacterium maritypicum]|uniref:tyrosine-type recombinase/integrase n=1 Tax=Microbacterium maritypicum TaxID=33918 RepID=UPI003828906A
MSKQKANRQAFGSVRQLPSGRWQARYPDPAGRPMNAPTTFPTKREAQDHIAGVRADRMRGTYRDHRAGLQPFGPYAVEWVANGGTRGRLAAKTQALYEDLLTGPLAAFHDRPLSAISPADVRAWYARTRKTLANAVKNRPGATGEARLRQAYSLLHTILNAAVKDRLISENPCQIEGAGQVNDPERPYLSPEALADIVAALPEKWHLPVRVAFGAHLRLGELVALQRGDYANGSLRVERQHLYVRGKKVTTPTKTGEARTVVLPPSIAAEVEAYLSATTGFPRSPLFPRRDGEAITGNALSHAWRKAARGIGLGQFHVHDLRHAGLTLAAQAGGTTRELMARAGHRTARAALIYQHAAEERNAALAGAMDALTAAAVNRARPPRLEAVLHLEITTPESRATP